MQVARRSFLKGIGLVVAAPAIVKVESLMRLPPKPKIVSPVVLTHPRLILGQYKGKVGVFITSADGELTIDFTNNTMTLKDLIVNGPMEIKRLVDKS